MTILESPVRADEPTILYSSHMEHVYRFGHQFQTPDRCDFIVAGSFDDAYAEMLDYAVEHDGECDHGGDLPDGLTVEQSMEWVDTHCDCDMTDDGRYVWTVDTWWIAETAMSVDDFLAQYGDDQ